MLDVNFRQIFTIFKQSVSFLLSNKRWLLGDFVPQTPYRNLSLESHWLIIINISSDPKIRHYSLTTFLTSVPYRPPAVRPTLPHRSNFIIRTLHVHSFTFCLNFQLSRFKKPSKPYYSVKFISVIYLILYYRK